MTTCLFGLFIASHSFSVSSFSLSAPTGQAIMHWPQYTQGASAMDTSYAGPTLVANPRLMNERTPISCFSQADTQRPHLMHLLPSLIMENDLSSYTDGLFSPSKVIPRIEYSSASVCSSQLRLRIQARQSLLWSESIISSVDFLVARTLALLV